MQQLRAGVELQAHEAAATGCHLAQAPQNFAVGDLLGIRQCQRQQRNPPEPADNAAAVRLDLSGGEQCKEGHQEVRRRLERGRGKHGIVDTAAGGIAAGAIGPIGAQGDVDAAQGQAQEAEDVQYGDLLDVPASQGRNHQKRAHGHQRDLFAVQHVIEIPRVAHVERYKFQQRGQQEEDGRGCAALLHRPGLRRRGLIHRRMLGGIAAGLRGLGAACGTCRGASAGLGPLLLLLALADDVCKDIQDNADGGRRDGDHQVFHTEIFKQREDAHGRKAGAEYAEKGSQNGVSIDDEVHACCSSLMCADAESGGMTWKRSPVDTHFT